MLSNTKTTEYPEVGLLRRHLSDHPRKYTAAHCAANLTDPEKLQGEAMPATPQRASFDIEHTK